MQRAEAFLVLGKLVLCLAGVILGQSHATVAVTVGGESVGGDWGVDSRTDVIMVTAESECGVTQPLGNFDFSIRGGWTILFNAQGAVIKVEECRYNYSHTSIYSHTSALHKRMMEELPHYTSNSSEGACKRHNSLLHNRLKCSERQSENLASLTSHLLLSKSGWWEEFSSARCAPDYAPDYTDLLFFLGLLDLP